MIKFDKNEKVCYNIKQDGIQYVICPCCKKQKLIKMEYLTMIITIIL